MFDTNIYNTYFDAAYQILQNNVNSFGQQFCQEFVTAHDIRTGNRYSQNSVQQMYNSVTQYIQRITNGAPSFDTQTLFNVMGEYLKHTFSEWQRSMAQRQNTGGFGGGGFSRPAGFSSPSGGFGQPSGFGGGGFGQPRQTAGSHFIDSGVATPPPPSQQSSFTNSAPVAANTNPIQEIKIMPNVSPNPLDDLHGQTIDLNTKAAAPNWGNTEPHDSSIAMMAKTTIKSADQKVFINAYDGFEMTYFDNPMDVVRDFFRVAPDQFVAEHFVFRIFYNHVECINIPTLDFLEARKKFIDSLNSNSGASVYSTVRSILDKMMHGPSMALADYLVKHINRHLKLSFGMAELPQLRISFGAIEDLDDLLGTTFNHKLLEVPGARDQIISLVNNAILNALTCYSDVMFTEENGRDIDIIRSSKVFPHSIANVYPSKDVIPSSGSPEAEKFFELMQVNELSSHTYVRSIRSVIVTNILGQAVLNTISDKPTLISSQIAAVLGTHTLNHHTRLSNEPQCRYYDTDVYATAEEDYREYINNPEKYSLDRLNKVVDFNEPTLPVDQTVFCIQYKTSPKDYLVALDLCTVMNKPSDRPYTLLSKKNIVDLKITN